MTELKQIRECDGACCKESPRWPDGNGGCVYLDGNNKCKVQAGEAELDGTPSPCFPDRDPQEVYQETCLDWPHNSKEGRSTGGCCWQWVNDGN